MKPAKPIYFGDRMKMVAAFCSTRDQASRLLRKIDRFYNGTSKYKPRIDTPKSERVKY